jgi:hypothetical protein
MGRGLKLAWVALDGAKSADSSFRFVVLPIHHGHAGTLLVH